MARWINIAEKAVPFDYRWPDRSAITAFTVAGDHFVKDEIADFAIERGYASEGKADEASRSSKSGARRVRRAKRKETAPAKTADVGTAEGLGDVDVPAADRPADRAGVDSDASER